MISKETNGRAENLGREIGELKAGMTVLGIEFDETAIERFTTYLETLYCHQGKLHLISHRDYERISRRHFLPSLLALPYVKHRARICDIGSGAGFPSVPLKILRPEVDLVLLESVAKKAGFLINLTERLRLERVEVVNMRAERYPGRSFDLVLLRAVGKIGKLLAVVDALVAPVGEAIFYKTQEADAELRRAGRAMEKLGFTAEIVKTLTPIERLPLALVIMRRSGRTSNLKYQTPKRNRIR